MTRTCLIVDDSAVTRLVGRKIVESLGFYCVEAQDGAEALNHCKQSMPEVILLDWNMPHLSGYDFMLALRDLPKGKAPVVIFCSSEGAISHIDLALKHGANEYLIKPFDTDMMRDKFIQTDLLPD